MTGETPDPSLPDDLLDRSAIEELALDCGPDMLEELRASLEEEGGAALAEAACASAAGDPETVARRLHMVRGAALSLGFSAFVRQARTLETAARSGVAPSEGECARLTALFSASLSAAARMTREACPASPVGRSGLE